MRLFCRGSEFGGKRPKGGDRFEVRMTNIVPQHVALVSVGRVSGAAVGDAAHPRVMCRHPLERIVAGYGRLR